jgi:hypothetical protein
MINCNIEVVIIYLGVTLARRLKLAIAIVPSKLVLIIA